MVDKEEYYSALNATYDQTTIKKPWNLEKTKQVIEILEEYQAKKHERNQKLSPTERYYCGKYGIVNISGISKVILKPKTGIDKIIFVTPLEEFFDKIDEQHKQTGHGGRDKVLQNLKKQCNIPRLAVEVYLELCKSCNLKKTRQHADLVVEPITSKDLNVRGQVDLIDFESCADGENKWVLIYQDHGTKFLYLRPLKSNRAVEVAVELLKIFLEQGSPVILQSDIGREFTTEVIKELVALWPECKIMNGQPRLKPSTQDVEQMLKTWMRENKSSNWSIGCYFVQWQKNTSYHPTIQRSPYNSMYGADPKEGLRSTNHPAGLIDRIFTEEDLKVVQATDNILDEMKIHSKQQASMVIMSQDIKHDTTDLYCCVCGNKNLDVQYCWKCNKTVHAICGIIQDHEGFGIKITCFLCVRKGNKTNWETLNDGQEETPVIMAKRSRASCNEFKGSDIPLEHFISLREACANQSMPSDQDNSN